MASCSALPQPNSSAATSSEALEHELTTQLDRSAFATRLSEALEMADEEQDVFNVIERATVEISEQTPMELLLADSSRANLGGRGDEPGAAAPGCSVKSPFSCVAVRRGTAVSSSRARR